MLLGIANMLHPRQLPLLTPASLQAMLQCSHQSQQPPESMLPGPPAQREAN
jgi:hypothetical protein